MFLKLTWSRTKLALETKLPGAHKRRREQINWYDIGLLLILSGYMLRYGCVKLSDRNSWRVCIYFYDSGCGRFRVAGIFRIFELVIERFAFLNPSDEHKTWDPESVVATLDDSIDRENICM